MRKENLRLQTRKEYNKSIQQGRGYFEKVRKETIEICKKKLINLKEEILLTRIDLKGRRQEKYKPQTYEEWIIKTRKQGKQEFNKVIENKDSVKIREHLEMAV